jgi:solute carrier family 35 (UDP-sugar transporter), member A1/2/3
MLTIGIAVVQLDGVKAKTGDESKGFSERFFGLVAVALACLISGLAGVWYMISLSQVRFSLFRFEKVLKGTKASLFLRNVQLSFFSFVPGLIGGWPY